MRVTDIELFSEDDLILRFPFGSPEIGDRFQVKAMYGLDADEVFPKFYGFGSTSKDPFYRVGRKAREIVMRLVVTPNWKIGETYSDVRDEIYRAISRSRTGMLTMHFKAGASIVAVTEGRITKLEVPHFNKDAELQITMVCEDPFLHSYSYTELVHSDLDTDGILRISDHVSTAPHGFEMKLTYTVNSSGFHMSDPDDEEWHFRITPVSNFLVDDELYLSSNHGEKRLDLVRSGVTTHLMDRVWDDSVWPIIFPGDNEIGWSSLDTSLTVDYIRYYNSFWGV